jgi:glycosyltransferase involved in cell wall biosynthesis
VAVPISSNPASGRAPGRAHTFGLLTTFPPTACGVATFSAALSRGLSATGATSRVVRVGRDGIPSKEVVGELVNGSAASASAASEILNECDVAVIQHEYGLYGGADGDEVIDVLGQLRVPSVLIAHTVLTSPTPHQRSVLEELVSLAGAVVVMSQAARDRLCFGFDVDPAKVTTIPHGAVIPTRLPRPSPFPSPTQPTPTLLTWGLVGPGKGIERVIDAMASLQGLPTRPRYLVAGRTHPKVLAADGELYRNARIEQARRNGVAESVCFDSTYRDVPSLTALIQGAAAVVLPYDSKEQATSGVLVDAIAAGRPVIATAFPHAIELLSSGAGIIVDHDDPEGLTRALRRVLTEPGLASSMAAEADRLAPTMSWAVVAGAYRALADRLVDERSALV